MSLIADALKAAQKEKAKRGARGGEEQARRFFTAFAAPHPGRNGARFQVPRPVVIVGTVFLAAVLTTVLVVVLAPRPGDPTAAATGDAAGGAAAEHDAGGAIEATSAGVAVAEDGIAAMPSDPAGGFGAPAGSSRRPASAPPAREPEHREPVRGEPARGEPASVGAVVSDGAPRSAEVGRGGLTVRITGGHAGASGMMQRALAAQDRGEHDAAIELYERILAADPGNVEAHTNLGTIQRVRGDFELAEDAFRRALRIRPGYSPALNNLGMVLDRQGLEDEARRAWEEALRFDPGNLDAKVNLATHYRVKGLYAESGRLLQEVLRVDPLMGQAHYALAQVLERQGDREGAIRHYTLFISTDGDRYPDLVPRVRRYVDRLRREGGNGS